ncbi:hypothetical protein [Arthrobacter sp. ES1]|uniref:hypothetical protein n=1 Tax=Arthrobacter sp. ES1 TaxID=1897056 RepID=UPI001CFF9227|nr:hypothetical protein [Arthrobacter sp. ES1]MCB5280340.1 hypothetical protein [Arthrobacter sp. ES1]
MSTAPKTKTIRLTDENVVDLLDCAGTGIAYWATSATVDEEAKTYRVLSSEVIEAEDGTEVTEKTLTFDEIRDAFNTLAHAGRLPDWQMREIADGDLGFDSEVADMTIQQAMFGEIVFG